jgi:hypothetical protein
MGESVGLPEAGGGALIIGACVVNAAKPDDVLRFFGIGASEA